jgi:hypothetical protein
MLITGPVITIGAIGLFLPMSGTMLYTSVLSGNGGNEYLVIRTDLLCGCVYEKVNSFNLCFKTSSEENLRCSSPIGKLERNRRN